MQTGRPGKLLFENGEQVLCFHGPMIYDAKILKSEWWTAEEMGADTGAHYFIHYKGWKTSWDEWVPESRVLKLTDANIQKQRELLEHYAQMKDKKAAALNNGASGESKKSDASAAQFKKRPRTDESVDKEEEYLKRPEIRIPIPDSLKVQLVDDWENVTKNQRLVSLPRDPTVAQILEEYRHSKMRGKNKERVDDLVEEVLEGLRQYFDRALGTILLYRFERQQYADIRKKYSVPMSQIYGAEHLLRLFVQLPMLIAHTAMEPDSILTLKEHLNQIVMFIQRNAGRYFLKEYENAPPEYLLN